jgi:hypothetical protein
VVTEYPSTGFHYGVKVALSAIAGSTSSDASAAARRFLVFNRGVGTKDPPV